MRVVLLKKAQQEFLVRLVVARLSAGLVPHPSYINHDLPTYKPISPMKSMTLRYHCTSCVSQLQSPNIVSRNV